MKKIPSGKFAFPMHFPFNIAEYQRKISVVVYFLLGALFLTEGIRTIFDNPYVCPPAEINYNGNFVIYLVSIILGILHLIMDLSITLVLIGYWALWAAFNYSKSNIVDISLLIFFSISSFIHWNESFNEDRIIYTPFLGILPLLVVLFIIILKQSGKSEYSD